MILNLQNQFLKFSKISLKTCEACFKLPIQIVRRKMENIILLQELTENEHKSDSIELHNIKCPAQNEKKVTADQAVTAHVTAGSAVTAHVTAVTVFVVKMTTMRMMASTIVYRS